MQVLLIIAGLLQVELLTLVLALFSHGLDQLLNILEPIQGTDEIEHMNTILVVGLAQPPAQLLQPYGFRAGIAHEHQQVGFGDVDPFIEQIAD
ncbi:hypothetical protein D3C78_1179610 [compost metagenome]